MTTTRAVRRVIGAGFLMACAPSVKARSTPFQQYSPRAEDADVKIYSAEKPMCPYTEVGLVSVEGSRKHTDANLEGLKREARKIGADAIIALSEGTTTKGAVPAGSIAIAIRRQVLSGTAVRFTDPKCTH